MFGKSKSTTDAETVSKKDSKEVSIKDTGPCQKSVRLFVSLERIQPVREAVLKGFQKEASIPGFRKGKAPANLIEKRYAQNIQEETMQRVMQQSLEQAAKDNDLHPIGPFEVSKADFNETKGLEVEARVEVEPTFKLSEYKKIAITRQPITIGPEDVDKGLEQLQESMAKMVPSEKPDQPKERKVPLIDDELAKDLGFEKLDKLKEHVEQKLREQKKAVQSQALESGIYEELLRRNEFGVPQRLIDNQTERLVQDFKMRLMLSKVPEEKANEEMVKYDQRLRTDAEQMVKIYFILDRIATKESISVTQDEMLAKLWELSERWRKDPAQVRKTLDEQKMWPSIVSNIRREKTVEFLLAQADISGDEIAQKNAASTEPMQAKTSETSKSVEEKK